MCRGERCWVGSSCSCAADTHFTAARIRAALKAAAASVRCCSCGTAQLQRSTWARRRSNRSTPRPWARKSTGTRTRTARATPRSWPRACRCRRLAEPWRSTRTSPTSPARRGTWPTAPGRATRCSRAARQRRVVEVLKVPALAAPQLGSCASSGRAWRL